MHRTLGGQTEYERVACGMRQEVTWGGPSCSTGLPRLVERRGRRLAPVPGSQGNSAGFRCVARGGAGLEADSAIGT